MDLVQGATILIVDDEEAVRAGLTRSLHGKGYTLVAAASAAAALEVLARQPVDLVLSDHHMPGMTGLDLLAAVRDRYPDTSRILLTGQADAAVGLRAIEEGRIYRALLKPCERAELQLTIYLALAHLELTRDHQRLLELVNGRPELVEALEAARRRDRRR